MRSFMVLGALLGSYILSAQIVFESSLEATFQKAQSSGKMVFIEYYNTNCPVCKKVGTLLEETEIGNFYNSNFINYRIDTDRDDNQKDLDFIESKNLHIDAVPKFLFFDAQQNFVHYAGISAQEKSILQVGEDALNPTKQLYRTPFFYDKGDRSLRLMYAYCQYAKLTNNMALLERLSDEIFQSIPTELLTSENSFIILKNCVITTENRLFDYWANKLDWIKTNQPTNYEQLLEVLHKIAAKDINDTTKVWDSKRIAQLKEKLQRIQYSNQIDALLFDKQVKAYQSEDNPQALIELLYQIQKSTASEPENFIYYLGEFRKMNYPQLQNEVSKLIDKLLKEKKNSSDPSDKEHLLKLQQLK